MDEKFDFTRGSILGKMIKFMVPVFGALVLQAMYGAVDMWVVGRFGTTAGISAVSTGSSIINLVTFTICGLSMGITVLIGRYIGEGKNHRIGKIIGGVIYFFAILSVILTVFMLIFADRLAVLMQAPKGAESLTALYVRICGGGIVFIIAYNVISSIFRGMGNSRLPLLFVAIACGVNVVGDLLFVAVFHMNVAGAALATILAQAVSVILSLMIIRKQKLPFGFHKTDIRFSKEVRKFLVLGAPIALQELLTNASFLALCAFVNKLDMDASAGYGIAQKIVSFVMLVPSALMQSMASMVAQNVGAGKEKRARQSMLYGMAVGAAVGVVIGMASFFFGDILAGLFTKDPAVIVRAAEYLKGFSPEAVVTCILFSFIGYYNGHEKTVFVMAQGLAQTCLVRLPMSYYMSSRNNASLAEIGLAAPTATVFGIMLCSIYFLVLNRTIKIEEKERICNEMEC